MLFFVESRAFDSRGLMRVSPRRFLFFQRHPGGFPVFGLRGEDFFRVPFVSLLGDGDCDVSASVGAGASKTR